MRTSLLSVLLLCGMQGVGLAQLGVMERGYESELSDSSVEDIIGKDFFDFRRPSTLRAAPTRGTVRSAPAGKRGYGWDYRFDAQYQSTIKPHMRWYMRNDPNRPGERYLPRYMTSQGNNYVEPAHNSGDSTYGTSYGCSTGGCSMNYGQSVPVYGAPGCSSCGTSNYGYQGHGYQPRSRYWQHLDYLQSQYGSTPARPRRLKSSQTNGSRSMTRTTTGRTKTVWVNKDAETNIVSVLFVQPPAAQAHKFFKGKATLTNAMKLAGINWETEPEWSADVKLANSGTMNKS